MILRDSGGSTLCGHGMASHWVNFGNEGDFGIRIRLGGSDSGAKSRSACAYHSKIGLKGMHDIPPGFIISHNGMRRRRTCLLLLFVGGSITLGEKGKFDVFDCFAVLHHPLITQVDKCQSGSVIWRPFIMFSKCIAQNLSLLADAGRLRALIRIRRKYHERDGNLAAERIHS